MKCVTVGHIYRTKFPYGVDSDFVLKNKLLVVEMFFEGKVKQTVTERLKACYGEAFFNDVYSRMDRELIESEREYLKSINERDMAFFLFKNTELRGK